ncbi:hypothetical protein RI054_43g151280 [Pseudoscourfieldia marina]
MLDSRAHVFCVCATYLPCCTFTAGVSGEVSPVHGLSGVDKTLPSAQAQARIRAFACVLTDGGIRILAERHPENAKPSSSAASTPTHGPWELLASPDAGGMASKAKTGGGPPADAAFAPANTSAGTTLAVLNEQGDVRLLAPRKGRPASWECVDTLAANNSSEKGTCLAWRSPNRAAADQAHSKADAEQLTRAFLAVGHTSGVVVWAHRPELRRWERVASIATQTPVTAICFRPPVGAVADGRDAIAVATGENVTRYTLAPASSGALPFTADPMPLSPVNMKHPSSVWRLEYNDAATALLACFEHAPDHWSDNIPCAWVWAPDLTGEWASRAEVHRDGSLHPL